MKFKKNNPRRPNNIENNNAWFINRLPIGNGREHVLAINLS